MNRFAILAACFFLVFGLGTPASTQAQVDLQIGPRVGLPVGDMSDLEGVFFIGADARINSEELPVVLSPSLDFYLFDSPEGVDQTGFAIDLNGFYEFGVDNESFTPYAGGGLGITRYSADFENDSLNGFGFGGDGTTEVGLNLVGGVRFLLESVQPFVQVNATLGSDIDRFGLAGGVLFNI
jgi:opacity protein-like surface antigen